MLRGKVYTLRYDHFCKVFEFPTTGYTTIPDEFDAGDFWLKVSTNAPHWLSSKHGSSYLASLPLWLLHRTIAHSVNVRGKSIEKVTKTDLFFMWCALEGKKVETGRFFIQNLQ